MMSIQEAGIGRMDGLEALKARVVKENSCKCLERKFLKAPGLKF